MIDSSSINLPIRQSQVPEILRPKIEEHLWETYSVSKPCGCGGITSGNCNGCCNASTIIGQRMRAPEEVARIKAERQRKEEDDILRQAKEIKMRRGLT